MEIAFISYFLNHHQIAVADELWELSGHNFYFVETMPFPENRIKQGFPVFDDRPYIIKSYVDSAAWSEAKKIVEEADVVIYGGIDMRLFAERLKTNKLTFEFGERLLKKGIINIASPTNLKGLFYYHFKANKDRLYYLCASAYTANDLYLFNAYKDHCFKWGYFIQNSPSDIKLILNNKPNTNRIMWCARFIDWKHPELVIALARELKKDGYDFHVDMFGSGPFHDKMKQMSVNLNVQDSVSFCGNVPNHQLLEEMRAHDLILFTSDRNEGWGVITNEAMANGCPIVASNEIGSVPFLIKDGYNGLIFQSNDLDSLVSKVKQMINHPEKKQEYAYNAYETITKEWSAKNAAQRLYILFESLLNNNPIVYTTGPCSKAEPTK